LSDLAEPLLKEKAVKPIALMEIPVKPLAEIIVRVEEKPKEAVAEKPAEEIKIEEKPKAVPLPPEFEKQPEWVKILTEIVSFGEPEKKGEYARRVIERKEEFEKLGRAIEAVYRKSKEEYEKAKEFLAPRLKKIAKEAKEKVAPAIKSFIERVKEAIKKRRERALEEAERQKGAKELERLAKVV